MCEGCEESYLELSETKESGDLRGDQTGGKMIMTWAPFVFGNFIVMHVSKNKLLSMVVVQWIKIVRVKECGR